jgi:hypothetical protein
MRVDPRQPWFGMQTTKIDIAGIRAALGWSTVTLAQELGVAPLTVQRWEKKDAKSTAGNSSHSKGGRPTVVPPHVRLALEFILLREGKKQGAPTIAKLRLPDVLGATLPIVAKEAGLFGQWGLDLQIEGCDTGEEALHAIAEGRADIAGAAKGLIKDAQDRALVDLGAIMCSQAVFQVLHPRHRTSPTSARGAVGKKARRSNLAAGAGRAPVFAGESSDYLDSKILYPRGSDLRNLLEKVRHRLGDRVTLEDVDRSDAVEALKARKGSEKLFYVAWEPLVSRVAAALPSDSYGKRQLELPELKFELEYEFHLVCSRSWCDANPRALFGMICALAQAERRFVEEPTRWVRHMWNEHWKLHSGSPREVDVKKMVAEIAFAPSSVVLRVLDGAKPVIIDRAFLEAATLRPK